MSDPSYLTLDRLTLAYGDTVAVRDLDLVDRQRRTGGPARSFRLRQDDDDAGDRRTD